MINPKGGLLTIEILPIDLLDNIQLESLIVRLRQDNQLYGLISCAGLPSQPFLDIKDGSYDAKMLMLNLQIPIELSRVAISVYRQNNTGFIINVCSLAGLINGFSCTVYSTTKAGLIKFSQALTRESQLKGITIQALCPGKVATDFEIDSETTGQFPKPLLLTPQQVVKASLDDLIAAKVISVPSWAYRWLVMLDKIRAARYGLKLLFILMRFGVVPKVVFQKK